MAAFTNITPPDNSYVYSQNIQQNTTYYNYYGVVTLKANSGYYFDSAETYVMYKPGDTASRVNGVIQTDNTVCVFTIYSNNYRYGNLANEIVFDGVLSSLARELTISQNLQNCTISGLPSTVTDVTDLSLTLTAANGYRFDTAPRLNFDVTILDGDGNPRNYIDFVVSSDKLTAYLSIDLAVCNLEYVTTCETLTINATAAAIVIHSVAVTTVYENCTTNTPQNISENSGTVNIIATPSNGYQFDTAPTITFYDNNGGTVYEVTFTVLSSKLSANVTINVANIQNFTNVESIILRATAAAIPQQTVTVNTEIQNAVLNGLPQNVYADSVLTLIATANNGYYFDNAPIVYIIDGNGNPYILRFTLSDNDTVAQCTVNVGGYSDMVDGTITITATASAITPYVEKYGTINVYKVTTENLAQFAAVRFKKEKDTPSDTSGYFQLIDLGDYVVSVKRFYCTISDVLTAYISAGNYNTDIQCETPQNDNFTIDCGNVIVPSVNQSITDYQNSEIKVFLPFVGFVSLSNDYVGKSVSLSYRVNIIKGDCVAVLSCNGVDIDYIQCTISNDLIFKTNKENNFGGNVEFNLQVLKGLQPYIVVKSNADLNAALYNVDCVHLPLSEISGYFTATELSEFISNTITVNEYEMLQNEIANGVILEV